jgi:hypothetical protein
MRSSSPPNMGSTDTQSEHHTQLSGTKLILARTICVALFGFCLTVFIADLPGFFTQLHLVCRSSDCALWQLTPTSVLALRQVGLTVESYAILSLTLSIFSVFVWSTVGTIIAWRKSNDWMALLVAILLVTTGVSGQSVFYLLASLVASTSPWFVPTMVVPFLTDFLYLLVFLLFPDGRFVPHWTSWLLIVGVALTGGAVILLLLHPLLSQWLNPLMGVGFVVTDTPALFVQIYRYRSVSTAIQRQQTKWVVLGAIVGLLVATGYLPLLLFSSLSGLYFLILRPVATLLLLFPPLCFAIAILRYHLWDIDILINRTLIYGTLTASLVLIYLGSILLFQSLLRQFIGPLAQNQLAIVGSTLLIAALFQPLRRGIQAIIDRRFYRRKYDAAKIVAAFSSTLRNEVDLPTLSEHLLAVVQETMQPTSVSLWLCKHGQPSKSTAKEITSV